MSFVSHNRNLTPELASAMAKFGAEVSNPDKNAHNPHFRSAYADLGEVLRVVRPTLAKHGLAMVQSVESYPDTVKRGGEDGGEIVEMGGDFLRTTLLHESGGFIESIVRVPHGDPGRGSLAQAIGSAVTYMRRYQALAICGIAADDDDGNSAGQPKNYQNRQPQSRPANQGQGNRGNAAPPPPPVVEVSDELKQRIASLDTIQKAESARGWIQSPDSGLSEPAKKKALALLDEQVAKLKESAA